MELFRNLSKILPTIDQNSSNLSQIRESYQEFVVNFAMNHPLKTLKDPHEPVKNVPRISSIIFLGYVSALHRDPSKVFPKIVMISTSTRHLRNPRSSSKESSQFNNSLKIFLIIRLEPLRRDWWSNGYRFYFIRRRSSVQPKARPFHCTLLLYLLLASIFNS